MLLMSIFVTGPFHPSRPHGAKAYARGSRSPSQLRKVGEDGGLTREESMEENINLHHYS